MELGTDPKDIEVASSDAVVGGAGMRSMSWPQFGETRQQSRTDAASETIEIASGGVAACSADEQLPSLSQTGNSSSIAQLSYDQRWFHVCEGEDWFACLNGLEYTALWLAGLGHIDNAGPLRRIADIARIGRLSIAEVEELAKEVLAAVAAKSH